MVKHTTGEWFAEPTPSSLFVTRAIYARREDGDIPIAHVGVPGLARAPGVHEEVANANLIVLAPAMVELLTGLADILELDCGCPPCIGSMAPAEDLLGRTRALLARLA